MLYLIQAIIYSLIFMFGASIFSFLNVVIYRVPQGMSFVGGRSFCPNCHTSLRGRDMIPVVSYLLLRGKCHHCKQAISLRYPLIECLGGVIAILSTIRYGYTLQAVLAFAFCAVLTVVAVVDQDTMEIPNGFVIAAVLFGAIAILVFGDIPIMSRIIGIFSVSIPLLILTLVIPGAFGGGDIKLMAACGLMLGWKLCLLALFLAVLSGGCYGAFLLISKKKGKKDHFAFGPFLCVASAVALFAGEKILSWYLGFLS